MMSPSFTRGSSFASYRIVERLGTSVFLVEDAGGRSAALRILPDAAPDLLARCFTEACSVSGPSSIARTYDVGVVGERAFIVTELVDGQSLARYLRRSGRLSTTEAIKIAQRIARALAAIHERGLAHGSVDLESILVCDDNEIALHGFGLAALGGGDPMSCLESLALPIYTSPEQCRSSTSYDARSDLYALGCILFQLLSGHPPFRSLRIGELVTSHMMAPPPSLPASIPRALRDLVPQLLAKNPDERPSAQYVIHALGGVLEDIELAAVPRAPLRWIAAFAVTFCLVIPLAYKHVVEKAPDIFHALDMRSLPR
jgi:serine/threonine-protein kinase